MYKNYVIYQIHNKLVRESYDSKNIALGVLGRYNKTRGELGFALMTREDYEANYGRQEHSDSEHNSVSISSNNSIHRPEIDWLY